MRRFASSMVGMMVGCLVLVVPAAVASAQDASGGQSAPPAIQSGPLVIQPVSSGFVITPEIRFSTVNHSNATFVGANGGWLYDDTLYVGGAWYWMTNGKNHQGMTYGGMVTGVNLPVNGAVRVGLRGLFGWGEAGLNENVTYYAEPHHTSSTPVTGTYHYDVGFWVFEPQATAVVRVTKKVSFEFGGGYRFTGRGGGWEHELQGGFGTVGIRFGAF